MGIWTGKYPYMRRTWRETPKKCPKCGTSMVQSEYESPDGDTRYYYYCPNCEAEATKRASERRMRENIEAMKDVIKFYNENKDLIENFDELPREKQLEIADSKSEPKMPYFMWAEERDAFSEEELKTFCKVKDFFRKLCKIRRSDEFIEYKAGKEAELVKKEGKVIIFGNRWEGEDDEEMPLNYESLKAYYWQLLAYKGKKYAIAFLRALNTPEAKKLLNQVSEVKE